MQRFFFLSQKLLQCEDLDLEKLYYSYNIYYAYYA